MMKGNISMQTLILFILVMVVIVVMVLVFTGKVALFTQTTTTCESQGGGCVKSMDDCPYRIANFKCSDSEKDVCCMPEV